MPDLEDGQTVEMQGSGAKPYVLKNTGGVYSCSCPAWRNQSLAIEKRTCKHLRKLRGDAAEEARIGGALPQRPAKAGGDSEEGAGPPLLLRLPNGTDFAIGTGFSDRERANPPPVGATVTFRYQELSEAGVPRFPSFVSVRLDRVIEPGQMVPALAPEKAPASAEAPKTVFPAVGATASRPRYFQFIGGNSSKFWEVSRAANTMTTRWGRIGSAGQSKTKTFADPQAAAKAVVNLIAEKTAEGYVEKSQRSLGRGGGPTLAFPGVFTGCSRDPVPFGPRK